MNHRDKVKGTADSGKDSAGRRIFLRVAYDGTRYAGFQVQNNGVGIQNVVDDALRDWLGEDIKTAAASRTDAGVHALGNVMVFDTESKIPGDKFAFGLNTGLPDDIRVQESFEVPSDFHPRFTSTIKTYEYKILNRTFPDPLRRIDSFFYHGKLDADAMNIAANMLVGEHDFASFCSTGNSHKSTVRTIYSAYVEREEDMIYFEITGNGFLYNMVRIIAGTLIEIGKGALNPRSMQKIIRARDRSQAGPTAPACGLTLVDIEYPEWGF